MKHFLATEHLDPDDQFLLFESVQQKTDQRANGGSVFDLCLALSVVLCVLELAVQLLRTETCLQAVTLILAVAIWAAIAVAIGTIKFSETGRLGALCAAALVCDLLFLVSRLTSSSVGFSMYVVDCFMKCILVLLSLHPRQKF